MQLRCVPGHAPAYTRSFFPGCRDRRSTEEGLHRCLPASVLAQILPVHQRDYRQEQVLLPVVSPDLPCEGLHTLHALRQLGNDPFG